MEFIKKNWVVIMVVAVIVAIVYYDRKKKAESSFMFTGCLDGTSPNPINGICDRRYDWNQVPTGVFSNRVFRTKNIRAAIS